MDMTPRTRLWSRAAILAIAATVTPVFAQPGSASTSSDYDTRDLTGFWVSDENLFTDAEAFARAVRLMRPDLEDYPEVEPRDYPNRHPTLPIRFTPEFEALHQQYLAESDAGKPYRTGYMCQSNGMLAAITSRLPLQIFAAPGKLMFQWSLVSWLYTVHMERPHKTDFVNPGLFGDSVGTWDGDTLVVDTINLGMHAVVIETEPHSRSLHVVQRISRPTYDTLVTDIVAYDPRAFLEPVKFHVTHRLDNSQEHAEAQCEFDGGGEPMAMAPE